MPFSFFLFMLVFSVKAGKDFCKNPSLDMRNKIGDMSAREINKRNEKAFLDAYDFYAPRIFRHIYFRVSSRELAEDITSQVFLKTWEYLLSDNIKNIKSFLYRVASNLLVDYYRKKPREPVQIDEGFENIFFYEKDIVKEINNQEELQDVRRAASRLKKDFRDIIVMRYIDGLSIEEISEISGKSKNAVCISISRAIVELKEILQDFPRI